MIIYALIKSDSLNRGDIQYFTAIDCLCDFIEDELDVDFSKETWEEISDISIFGEHELYWWWKRKTNRPPNDEREILDLLSKTLNTIFDPYTKGTYMVDASFSFELLHKKQQDIMALFDLNRTELTPTEILIILEDALEDYNEIVNMIDGEN